MAILFTIILSYLITTLFGHTVHWALHQPWSGKVNRAHMTHHIKLYPPSDYVSETYRDAGKDSTPKFFAIAALPLILTPIILWAMGLLPLSLMITVIVVEGVMGFLHNYLHDAFHIKNHWLYGMPLVRKYFSRLVELHYQHHVNLKSNYGIFSFHWDRIFRTFRS